jgi:hypothetical protein
VRGRVEAGDGVSRKKEAQSKEPGKWALEKPWVQAANN